MVQKKQRKKMDTDSRPQSTWQKITFTLIRRKQSWR